MDDFQLERADDVAGEVRRLALAELETAIQLVSELGPDPDQSVHGLRKQCKKLRALLRLVRPVLVEDYSLENRCYRDSARLLSRARDLYVAERRFEGLIGGLDTTSEGVAILRRRLKRRRDEVSRDEHLEERFAAVKQRLLEARGRVDGWRFVERRGDGSGFELVAEGVATTYRRFRNCCMNLHERATTERLHEWRKRAIYHRHHLQLLRLCWPPLLDALHAEVHRLTDLLGDDHDLASLARVLTELDMNEADGSELDVKGPGSILGRIAEQRRGLQAEALSLGDRLVAERDEALVDRLRHYWQAWSDRS